MRTSSNNLPGKSGYYIVVFILSVLAIHCKSGDKKNSIELIADDSRQSAIFNNLMQLTRSAVSNKEQEDSLAFLILPVQASCPACRNKTIDSIAEHKNDLPNNHFIIISANGGYKSIRGYFQENNKVMPETDKLLLDSTNEAHRLLLYENKPTIYYSSSRKVYKKVAAIPRTVREDLREFFSGHRMAP
ncbi:hypothetical protein A4D02_10775 [Niastella koreensis]|uniref:Uncharacterized protein n=2 Tax=Niastella koreensis TaxID=354356 RepID=G8T713_NIAKG|nr:hypothetical protein [Niastella koreensis]AEV99034.1 hypothetical protein Niako_2695 [Niastella koreensis GR20-10]OQP43951.1 hypothetical protein A4D02_10775 [Niastella koreensis]